MADYLTKEFYKKMKKQLRKRVSESRYEHSLGVVKTCKWLAKTYGVDKKKARLAGILHDWDKGLDQEQEIEKAKELKIDSCFNEWEMIHLSHLLHGLTAAADFRENYDDFPEDVAHAISVHTTAAVKMSDLDMCLYVADALEPGRDYPEKDRLRDMVGKVTLLELYETVFCLWTIKLIENKKLMKPSTVDIYNHLIENSEK